MTLFVASTYWHSKSVALLQLTLLHMKLLHWQVITAFEQALEHLACLNCLQAKSKQLVLNLSLRACRCAAIFDATIFTFR